MLFRQGQRETMCGRGHRGYICVKVLILSPTDERVLVGVVGVGRIVSPLQARSAFEVLQESIDWHELHPIH